MSARLQFALGFALTLGVLTVCGCKDEQPLRVELETHIAFDPTRFDAGPVPDVTGPLPTTLRFGITPFYSAERQRQMMNRLEKYLTDAVGIPVVTTVFPSYDSCVDALEKGELDIAQLSPFAYVKAEARIPDLLPIASSVAQGSTAYGSYLVARRESNILRWEDIKGKRVGFIDRLSTSGYLYPRIFLEEKGIDLDRDLAAIHFYGMHDLALDALMRGDIDVAAVSSDTLVNANVMGIHGPVRVVAKAGRIPYDAVVVRKTMPDVIRHRFRRAFLTLSIHNKRGRDVLEDFNLINGFMPVPKGHYSEVRRRAAKLLTPLKTVTPPPPAPPPSDAPAVPSPNPKREGETPVQTGAAR